MWCILCIIIPFLAAIIGAIIGYYLRKFSHKCDKEDKIRLEKCLSENQKLKSELETCSSERKKLQSDLDTCLSGRKKLELDLSASNSSLKNLQSDLDICLSNRKDLESALISCKTTNEELKSTKAKIKVENQETSSILGFAAVTDDVEEPTLVFDGAIAKQFIGKKVIPDNLTIVEGIGPKIAELFNLNGINTWYQLSRTSIERCQEILDTGGPRFAIHKPTTWPKQALLAFEGKWEELNIWQDELDGGR